MARKPYVPITRSAPSIIASLLTQKLGSSRAAKKADLHQRGFSPVGSSFARHPIFCIWLVLVVSIFMYAVLKKAFFELRRSVCCSECGVYSFLTDSL